MPIGAEKAVGAPPIPLAVGALAGGGARHVVLWTRTAFCCLCIATHAALGLAQLLLQLLIFLAESLRVPNVLIPAASAVPPASAPTRTAAPAAVAPAIAVLRPPAPRHVIVVASRGHAATPVVAGEEVSGLRDRDHCARSLPSTASPPMPRRLRRGGARARKENQRRCWPTSRSTEGHGEAAAEECAADAHHWRAAAGARAELAARRCPKEPILGDRWRPSPLENPRKREWENQRVTKDR